MYESKLSGLRGKAAREALLEAEAHEKKAAEAVEAEANLGTFWDWRVVLPGKQVARGHQMSRVTEVLFWSCQAIC